MTTAAAHLLRILKSELQELKERSEIWEGLRNMPEEELLKLPDEMKKYAIHVRLDKMLDIPVSENKKKDALTVFTKTTFYCECCGCEIVGTTEREPLKVHIMV